MIETTVEGGHFMAERPGPDGWYFPSSLGLYLGIVDGWLRLRPPDGKILATARETAETERQKAMADSPCRPAGPEAARVRAGRELRVPREGPVNRSARTPGCVPVRVEG